jgi:hypothetical protein
MEKRTTVILDKEIYEALVKESVEEYKTTKAISKVINNILKKTLKNKSSKLTGLLHSKKVATVTSREFEEFRGRLSKAV